MHGVDGGEKARYGALVPFAPIAPTSLSCSRMLGEIGRDILRPPASEQGAPRAGGIRARSWCRLLPAATVSRGHVARTGTTPSLAPHGRGRVEEGPSARHRRPENSAPAQPLFLLEQGRCARGARWRAPRPGGAREGTSRRALARSSPFTGLFAQPMALADKLSGGRSATSLPDPPPGDPGCGRMFYSLSARGARVETAKTRRVHHDGYEYSAPHARHWARAARSFTPPLRALRTQGVLITATPRRGGDACRTYSPEQVVPLSAREWGALIGLSEIPAHGGGGCRSRPSAPRPGRSLDHRERRRIPGREVIDLPSAASPAATDPRNGCRAAAEVAGEDRRGPRFRPPRLMAPAR